MSLRDQLERIEKIVHEAKQEAFTSGILEGIRTAESIMLMYSENPKLLEKYQKTDLELWNRANLRIDELKARIPKKES